jgi:hypothetical protein
MNYLLTHMGAGTAWVTGPSACTCTQTDRRI